MTTRIVTDSTAYLPERGRRAARHRGRPAPRRRRGPGPRRGPGHLGGAGRGGAARVHHRHHVAAHAAGLRRDVPASGRRGRDGDRLDPPVVADVGHGRGSPARGGRGARSRSRSSTARPSVWPWGSRSSLRPRRPPAAPTCPRSSTPCTRGSGPPASCSTSTPSSTCGGADASAPPRRCSGRPSRSSRSSPSAAVASCRSRRSARRRGRSPASRRWSSSRSRREATSSTSRSTTSTHRPARSRSRASCAPWSRARPRSSSSSSGPSSARTSVPAPSPSPCQPRPGEPLPETAVTGRGRRVVSVGTVLAWAGGVLAAFLVGSLNPATMIARLLGKDLASSGSGNPGATNAGRVLGRKWGVVVGVLDVLKGLVPTLVAGHLFGAHAAYAVGIAAVLGHIWSPFLKGRGGKGVATTLGAILGVHPWVALVVVVVFAVAVAAHPLGRCRLDLRRAGDARRRGPHLDRSRTRRRVDRPVAHGDRAARARPSQEQRRRLVAPATPALSGFVPLRPLRPTSLPGSLAANGVPRPTRRRLRSKASTRGSP